MSVRFKSSLDRYVTAKDINKLLDAIEGEIEPQLMKLLPITETYAKRLSDMEAEIKRLRSELDAERRHRLSPMRHRR